MNVQRAQREVLRREHPKFELAIYTARSRMLEPCAHRNIEIVTAKLIDAAWWWVGVQKLPLFASPANRKRHPPTYPHDAEHSDENYVA